MKRNKLSVILASVVVLLLLCASASFAANVIKIKVAHTLTEESYIHVAAAEYFKPYVEKESQGRVEVQIYPNGQLGADRQTTEGVKLGTVEMTITANGTSSLFVPSCVVWDLPFIFESREVAYKVLDGPFGQKISDDFLKVGLRNLVWAETGFRNFTNNLRPITTPDDLKGMKLRTMENPVFITAFRALGANPTPMSFGELYTGLQQHTVDGQENPITHIYTQRFYEVQKYLTISHHSYTPASLIVNDKWFTSLPEDIQQIITKGAEIYRDECRRLAEEQETDMLEKLKAIGMEVNELTPEQRTLFFEGSKAAYDLVEETTPNGKELVEELLAAIKAAQQ